MYPYHNQIKKRIRNREYVNHEFVIEVQNLQVTHGLKVADNGGCMKRGLVTTFKLPTNLSAMFFMPCYKQCGQFRKHFIKCTVKFLIFFWAGFICILLIINLNKNN